MILALSPKTDYTASLQMRSLGSREPRIPNMNVVSISPKVIKSEWDSAIDGASITYMGLYPFILLDTTT